MSPAISAGQVAAENQKDCVKTKQTYWSLGLMIASSMPVILIIAGILLKLLAFAVHPLQQLTLLHPNNTTIENAVLFGGLYLALPCGLLNVVMGIIARSKGWLKKAVAITGTSIGGIGILLGLLAWFYFLLVSSFEF